MTDFKDKVLSDCFSEDAFWTTNGIVCRNIHELANNIEGQDERTFRYHVNEDNDKNDYAKWIRETLGDEELADRLQGVMDKDRFVDIIRQRIIEIEEGIVLEE